MFVPKHLCLTVLSLAILPAHAVDQASNSVCAQLAARRPSKVAYPPGSSSSQPNGTSISAAYTEAQSRYWDTANADDIPACAFFPSTAQDVSTALKLLNKSPTTPFALKSGGHNWNRGFSSTDGGVLISFRPNMNYTKLSADTRSAEVGPGSRWGEVMTVLDKHNLSVVGGRVGDVGVGGYVPLGGISYMTAERGFSSDNVVNFEVVTANGTILNANKTSHPDIFFAIRGGGNLFGVVTKYTLATYPIGNVWGGTKTYTREHFTQVFSAITNYTAHFSETRSAISPTLIWLLGSNGTVMPSFSIFFFWNGDQPPAHVFAEFDAIPSSSNTVKTQRYPELLTVDVPSGITFRTSDAISSLPNMPHDQMMDFFQRHYDQISKATFISKPGLEIFSLDIQPIPVALQKANYDRGPAALATNPAGGDKIWIEYSLGWADAKYDGTWPQELINVVNSGRDLQQLEYAGVKPTNYKSGDLCKVPYEPLFANDAQVGQPVLQSYGNETYNRLRKLHATLDPTDMFLLQTKGFKF